PSIDTPSLHDALPICLQLLTPLLIWQRWTSRATQFAQRDRQYLAQQDRQQQLTSALALLQQWALAASLVMLLWQGWPLLAEGAVDRKSRRLNSSHVKI